MPRLAPPLNANRVTARYYEHIGLIMLRRDPNGRTNSADFQRAYREMFGCSPRVCVTLWRHADVRLVYLGAHPQHVLWALLFLKVYATNVPLCVLAGTSRPTYTKWVWRYIPSIAKLRPRVVRLFCSGYVVPVWYPLTLSPFAQIRLENRFRTGRFGNCNRSCKMTIDGTDFRIQQPAPYSTTWYSHKFEGPGVRYEVGVCIQTGDIVWVNGPFRCGSWPDLLIFKTYLQHRLEPHEFVEADGTYRHPKCRLPDAYVSEADKRAKDDARHRHEGINGFFKAFGVLKQIFRHDLRTHAYCFACVVVVVQLGIDDGSIHPWAVRY